MEVLWAGQEMRWIVTDGKEALVDMRLHNDISYREAFRRIQASRLLEAPMAAAFDRSHPVKQSEIDIVKQTARENTARLRQELERKPRASPEEIAQYAKQLTVLGGVARAYDMMRRDDFCDVVLAAFREGNLSEQQASQASYVREWVLSGADRLTSFPEWLATGEVLDRFAVLQREWLQAARQDAAINRMSFHEWLAATDTRRP